MLWVLLSSLLPRVASFSLGFHFSAHWIKHEVVFASLKKMNLGRILSCFYCFLLNWSLSLFVLRSVRLFFCCWFLRTANWTKRAEVRLNWQKIQALEWFYFLLFVFFSFFYWFLHFSAVSAVNWSFQVSLTILLLRICPKFSRFFNRNQRFGCRKNHRFLGFFVINMIEFLLYIVINLTYRLSFLKVSFLPR